MTNIRNSTLIQIHKEYIENEKNGLCKVCGKKKELWEKHRKKYCSAGCVEKYGECFVTWDLRRNQILIRDGCCVFCGSKENLEVDHIVALINGGDMWDENNLRVLCHDCHVCKTKNDLYERKYVKYGQKRLLSV